MPHFFTVAESAGLRYEFVPRFPFPFKPRVGGAEVRSKAREDPLGIERCPHRIVLTDRPQRALKLFVDVLGGTVAWVGRNQELGASSTCVRLADAVFEFAVPDGSTAAHADWLTNAPEDTYHSIAFRVIDLDVVERQIRSRGIGVGSRSDNALMTDPAKSLGIPWKFTTMTAPWGSAFSE